MRNASSRTAAKRNIRRENILFLFRKLQITVYPESRTVQRRSAERKQLRVLPLNKISMDFLFSASLVASFFAGIAALFAPCCITVLLPTYFGSVFKTKRKVFLMTFIYFLGLLAVFIPIGLGVSVITQLLRSYHNQIFIGGGTFLILLGIALTAGYRFSLPIPVHPVLTKYDAFSVFVLGIFSAVATTCCAPVLAGVLALSAIPGSAFLGTLYTLTYVLGMVTPLFLLAAILDKTELSGKIMILRRPISYRVFGLTIKNTVANMISGLTFLGIGAAILYLAFTNRLMVQNDFQLTATITLASVTKRVSAITRILPEYVWAIVFASILLAVVIRAVNQLMEKNRKEVNT